MYLVFAFCIHKVICPSDVTLWCLIPKVMWSSEITLWCCLTPKVMWPFEVTLMLFDSQCDLPSEVALWCLTRNVICHLKSHFDDWLAMWSAIWSHTLMLFDSKSDLSIWSHTLIFGLQRYMSIWGRTLMFDSQCDLLIWSHFDVVQLKKWSVHLKS